MPEPGIELLPPLFFLSFRGLDITEDVEALHNMIIKVALNDQASGDDPAFVRWIIERLPDELSRGEVADAFSAAADELRSREEQPWVDESRSLADTLDETAWALLSRGWPPVTEVIPDDDGEEITF